VGSAPLGVDVDASTDTVYVGDDNGNTVSVIDGATNTVTATVPVGTNPSSVSVDAYTDTVYAANLGDNTVSVIDGATNTVTATVPVGSDPEAVSVDPSTDTIYVANFSNTVSVIDGATNTVTATVPVGTNPDSVSVDASTHAAYVTNINGRTVSVITSVTTGPLQITTTSLPAASVGQRYSFQLQATGGTAPYSWNKYRPKGSGALPHGLSLSRSGLISGTPKKAGTFTIVVKCLQATAHPNKTLATQALTITVNP
jgi:YVTN family beta-propeller protein